MEHCKESISAVLILVWVVTEIFIHKVLNDYGNSQWCVVRGASRKINKYTSLYSKLTTVQLLAIERESYELFHFGPKMKQWVECNPPGMQYGLNYLIWYSEFASAFISNFICSKFEKKDYINTFIFQESSDPIFTTNNLSAKYSDLKWRAPLLISSPTKTMGHVLSYKFKKGPKLFPLFWLMALKLKTCPFR